MASGSASRRRKQHSLSRSRRRRRARHSSGVRRRILRKWKGCGWVCGIITSTNEDARRSIAGDKVNFFAQYDGEEEEVPHVLELREYQTTGDAEYDS
eukprot:329509-Prymnesium_polylepis.1